MIGWRTVVGPPLFRMLELLCAGHAIAKTKYVHQVAAKFLYILMIDAFQKSSINVSKQRTFSKRYREMESCSPQLKFWSIALRMELEYLLLPWAVRKGDFLLYISTIWKAVTMDFCFGSHPLARWLAISHYNMEMLSTTNQDVFNKFCNRNFTVKRTRTLFLL